ncbi:hypothetical protein [Bacillus pacificus]|nr:hypothetical protein [Bacillus pacificus]
MKNAIREIIDSVEFAKGLFIILILLPVVIMLVSLVLWFYQ